MEPKTIYQMHYDSLVIDGHSDFLDRACKGDVSFGDNSTSLQSGIFKLKDGGVNVQVFAVYIKPQNEREVGARLYAVEQILLLNKFEEEYRDHFEIGKRLKDIGRIVSEDKVCGLIGIEGGEALEASIDNLWEFQELGVRYITLTWNHSNQIGSSAFDELNHTTSGGLTNFGKDLVKEMNKSGIIIDVSHLGESCFWEVIKLSEQPIIASHSNCYSLHPHFRNLKDEQIKAIADNEGIVMVNFHSGFLSEKANVNYTALEVYKDKLKELYNQAEGDLVKFNVLRANFFENTILPDAVMADNVIEHINHIRNLVGVDHIGLGSDFDGGISPPFDVYDSSCYPVLTRKLYENGYSENDIKKILGLNFLRVYYTVCK